MNARTALNEMLRELAQPEMRPRPAPVRRGPLHWFTYPIEDLKLWTLEIGYRASRESPEDDYEVEIVEIEQWTPAGKTALDPSSLHNGDRLRIEDEIRVDHGNREAGRRL